MRENSGIYISGDISGGTFNQNTGSGNMQVGTSAPHDPQLAVVIARVDELLAALRACAPQLPPDQAEMLVEGADQLRDEVHNGRPSAERVRIALRNLGVAAAPVVSVLAQVNEIKDLVTSLLH